MFDFFAFSAIIFRTMGTIINVVCIIAGGILGVLLKSRLPERFRQTLMKSASVAVLFIGIGGTLSKMLVIQDGRIGTDGTMMLIISLALGSLLGELVNLDALIERFGEWLKVRTSSAGDNYFVNAFVTASVTVSIGAMAVVGSIEDGIHGDYSILTAKGILDLIIIFVLAASLGKGALFSFIPVGIFQGTVTLLAKVAAPLCTDAAMSNLSYIGFVLIFCVGVNCLWPEIKIRVANMLPSIFIAAAWAFLPF